MPVDMRAPLVGEVVRWQRDVPMATLVLKATLELQPGELVVSRHPRPIEGDVQTTSGNMRYASDRIPGKERAEWQVVGHAFSNEPRTSIDVAIGLGQNTKRCSACVGQPSRTVPLLDTYLRKGPQSHERVRLGPLPTPAWLATNPMEDHRPFNTAPSDQRVATITPGMSLVLEGLNPDEPVIRTRLPIERPAVRIRTATGVVPLEMRCDTLWIDSDARIACMVWRGVVPHPGANATYVVTWSETARARPRQRAGAQTVDLEDLADLVPLPFDATPSSAPSAPLAETTAPMRTPSPDALPPYIQEAMARAKIDPSQPPGSGTMNRAKPASDDGLPFERPQRKRAVTTKSLPRLEPSLPFQPSEGELPPHLASFLEELGDNADVGRTVQPLPRAREERALPFAEDAPTSTVPAHAPSTPSVQPPPVPTTLPQPVSSSSPMSASTLQPPTQQPPAPASHTPATHRPAPPASQPVALPQPRPERARLSMDRLATVRAALLDGETLANALARLQIDEVTYRDSDRMLAIDLARENRDGGNALAASFQRAIAAAQRATPPKPADNDAPELDLYIHIRAEIEEASDPKAALAELGMTTDTWRKLRRQWTRRALADPTLAEEIRERLSTRRKEIRRVADH